MKKCNKCKEDKCLSDFYNKKASKDGKAAWCKKCTLGKSYSPEVNRRSKLKSAYGITPEEYTEMLESQGGTCGICRRFIPHLGDNMCVDHDHSTGKVRGILCANCNRAIGLLEDNIKYLEGAIRYLGG